jgi:hypothetical protein
VIVRAESIAAPVLERLAGCTRVRVRTGGRAAYLELGGFIALLAGPGAPMLPNAIALSGAPPQADGDAMVAVGALTLPGWGARWDAERPPRWDPVLAPLQPGPRLAARGEAILAELGGPAPELGPWLVGRGAGLTPEGDDVLAGACAVLAAAGRADRAAALLPADLRERTTALSATLLELAVQGAAAAPLHDLVDPGRASWRDALAEMRALGHTSGGAMAVGAAAAAARTDGQAIRAAPVTSSPATSAKSLRAPRMRRPRWGR